MTEKSTRWRGANYDSADDLAPTLAQRLENLTARVRELVGPEAQPEFRRRTEPTDVLQVL